jgi:diguanylate cyclase (GGDEF)-like protein
LARLGGDEFGILLPDADAATAKALADRAIASVGLPYGVLGVPAIVGVSVGIEVAEAGPVDGDELNRTADRGLYAAKAAGKGQAVLASAA